MESLSVTCLACCVCLACGARSLSGCELNPLDIKLALILHFSATRDPVSVW